MRERHITIGLHIIAWIIFLSLPLLLLPKALEHVTRNPFQFIVVDSMLIVFYYLNAYFLVPRYLSQKKLVAYTLSVLLYLGVFLYLPYFGTTTYPPPPNNRSESLNKETKRMRMDSLPRLTPEEAIEERIPDQDNFATGKVKRLYLHLLLNRMNSLILFLLVFAMSTGVQLLSELFDTRRKKESLEHQKSKAELAFLRSQTNPHFLFNVLNSLYALSLTKSDKTPDAIMKLSGIMRYVITETAKDFVPLSNEIDYIEQYIDLQQLRLPEKTKVHFEVDGDPSNKVIAPLILIFYIENAFKYGLSASTEAHINIELHIKDNGLVFKVTNQKFDFTNKEDNTNIGLENVKQRLDLMYPQRYTLVIDESEHLFSVLLELVFVDSSLPQF